MQSVTELGCDIRLIREKISDVLAFFTHIMNEKEDCICKKCVKIACQDDTSI
jgi:hypothetical protein